MTEYISIPGVTATYGFGITTPLEPAGEGDFKNAFASKPAPTNACQRPYDIGFIVDKDVAMSPNKACPVILSNIAGPRILLLRHPLAGVQLVKGTIESGEAHPVLRRALGYLATMLFGEAQES